MAANSVNPTLLLIDTSSEAQVVGVLHDGELFEEFEIVGRGHSRLLLPTIRAALAAAGVEKKDLAGIVVGQGPGSFTGIRVGVGVVQGLAFGLDIPVMPVSSLAVIAQTEFERTGEIHIPVALTAREEEVYFGSYEVKDGLAVLVGEEQVVEASRAPPQTFDVCLGAGSGWRLREQLERALGVSCTAVVLEVWPRAVGLARLGMDAWRRGEVVSAAETTPRYLRQKVAERPRS